MDINLIRTFLEVNRARHFGRAADNLCVTQSAVSARIRLLEETLGVALFTRQRNNIDLTPAGTKFVRYADSILNIWFRACQDLAVEDSAQGLLSIGGTPSLWDIFLQDWLNKVSDVLPNLNINAEVHHSETLLRKLLDRALDLTIGFESLQTNEIELVEIRPISFVLVSTTPNQSAEETVNTDYVYVDWGTFFGVKHAQYFPDLKPPRLRVQLGRIALNHILQCGGSAYLAESMVQKELRENKLYKVEGAPAISRSSYAAYLPGSDKSDIIRQIIASLAV